MEIGKVASHGSRHLAEPMYLHVQTGNVRVMGSGLRGAHRIHLERCCIYPEASLPLSSRYKQPRLAKDGIGLTLLLSL